MPERWESWGNIVGFGSVGLSNMFLGRVSSSWSWLPVQLVISLAVGLAIRWCVYAWPRHRAARTS